MPNIKDKIKHICENGTTEYEKDNRVIITLDDDNFLIVLLDTFINDNGIITDDSKVDEVWLNDDIKVTELIPSEHIKNWQSWYNEFLYDCNYIWWEDYDPCSDWENSGMRTSDFIW